MVYFLFIFFNPFTPGVEKSVTDFKLPMQLMSETSVCWGMVDFHVVPTEDALCGSHACQRNFQLFFP